MIYKEETEKEKKSIFSYGIQSLTCGVFPFPTDPFPKQHEALCGERVGIL